MHTPSKPEGNHLLESSLAILLMLVLSLAIPGVAYLIHDPELFRGVHVRELLHEFKAFPAGLAMYVVPVPDAVERWLFPGYLLYGALIVAAGCLKRRRTLLYLLLAWSVLVIINTGGCMFAEHRVLQELTP